MSGDAGAVPLLVLSPGVRPLLAAARAVLAVPGLPPIAMIGGLAVTARLATSVAAYRATADVDFVVDDVDPTILELLTEAGLAAASGIRVAGVKVDVIPTVAVEDGDLDGLDDGDRLFLAAHRWALDTAQLMELTTPNAEPLILRVATPSGLIAAKSHAAGFARSGRRATKHASDLLDLYSLVEAFGLDVADTLRTAPGGIGRIVADVITAEVLRNPAAAARMMATSAARPMSAEVVEDVLLDFVHQLG